MNNPMFLESPQWLINTFQVQLNDLNDWQKAVIITAGQLLSNAEYFHLTMDQPFLQSVSIQYDQNHLRQIDIENDIHFGDVKPIGENGTISILWGNHSGDTVILSVQSYHVCYNESWASYYWQAVDWNGYSIISDIYGDNFSDALDEVKRQLTENPSRKAYYDKWVRDGKGMKVKK